MKAQKKENPPDRRVEQNVSKPSQSAFSIVRIS